MILTADFLSAFPPTSPVTVVLIHFYPADHSTLHRVCPLLLPLPAWFHWNKTAHSLTWFLTAVAVLPGCVSAVLALEMSPVIRWRVKKSLSFVC